MAVLPKYTEYECFSLNTDLPHYGLRQGMVGVVLIAPKTQPYEYEVEFVDSEGYTIAQVTMREQLTDPAEPHGDKSR